jgi:hypothetical protein
MGYIEIDEEDKIINTNSRLNNIENLSVYGVKVRGDLKKDKLSNIKEVKENCRGGYRIIWGYINKGNIVAFCFSKNLKSKICRINNIKRKEDEVILLLESYDGDLFKITGKIEKELTMY